MEYPERHLPLMPVVIVTDPDLFLDYMDTVFGAKTLGVVSDDQGLVSGELRVGQGVVLFQRGEQNRGTQAMVYVDDVQELYKTGLMCEGESVMDPTLSDWGFTAAFADPFGNVWFAVQA